VIPSGEEELVTDEKPKVVVITGPTASGKSSLAIDLALHFGAEIVNADSMQVYRGMDVGTAKPTITERRGVPHHLLDVADPDEDFDAAKYRSLGIPILHDIASRNKISLLVGGTGLYIKSLLSGLFECPPADPELRDELRRIWEARGPAYLYERLKSFDPESARKIHRNDRSRIIRALEVYSLTRQPFSSLIRRHGFKDQPFHTLKICLQVDRPQLYDRINRRSVFMIEAGLVAETERLIMKGYTPDLKPMNSLGYRHIRKFLDGEYDLDEAILQLQRDTRRYAKRQVTWFRADPEMVWIEPDDLAGFIQRIGAFYEMRT
jgi:tRNA dimethylallyltransferase